MSSSGNLELQSILRSRPETLLGTTSGLPELVRARSDLVRPEVCLRSERRHPDAWRYRPYLLFRPSTRARIDRARLWLSTESVLRDLRAVDSAPRYVVPKLVDNSHRRAESPRDSLTPHQTSRVRSAVLHRAECPVAFC